MDLNIVRIRIPVDGRPFTENSVVNICYVGAHAIVDMLRDSQLFTKAEAEEAIRELSQRLGLTHAKFETIKLNTLADDDVPEIKPLAMWSQVEKGDIETVSNFLKLDYPTGDYKASSSSILTGANQFFVSQTITKRLQVVVSIPGYFSDIAGLFVEDYGFSRVSFEPVGYGLSLYTVFTFTE